jgi:hypothetical protein
MGNGTGGGENGEEKEGQQGPPKRYLPDYTVSHSRRAAQVHRRRTYTVHGGNTVT